MRQSRIEEVAYFKKMGVCIKVPIEEVIGVPGKRPIGDRWGDVNKQTEEDHKYRSRLVAKEIKRGPKPELYAATPPLECLRMVVSGALNKSACRSDGSRIMNIMVCDVSRAYFYALAVRPVYVQIVEEDIEPGDESKCGRLSVSMYGTRDAALNWNQHCRDHLISIGFEQ